jgi:hypothetical protein
VIDTVLYSYLIGWFVTTIGLALTVRKLQDPVRPQLHPTPLVVAAGAAWPLLVLGAAQMAAVALVMNVARNRRSRGRSIHEYSSRAVAHFAAEPYPADRKLLLFQ